MSNHFYGTATEAHYEKEIKDFTTADWAVCITFLLVILSAVVMGFMQHWGIMVILVGIVFCMFDVFVRVLFQVKNKVTQLFFAIGIAIMIGGGITCTGHYEYLFLYGIAVYLVVAFGVGFFCLGLARKKRKKINEYTLTVEADCELVDIKRINLYRFDDINSDPLNPMNDNTLVKPAFHYYVNGEEYFTESDVYYGDLNQGFEEGAKVTLRVNPNEPAEILPQNAGTFMETCMGVSWIVIGFITIGILVVCYFLFGTFQN